LRVAGDGRGRAEALPHAGGELADAPARDRRKAGLVEDLVHTAIGDAVRGG
jgi:hypothetical protein